MIGPRHLEIQPSPGPSNLSQSICELSRLNLDSRLFDAALGLEPIVQDHQIDRRNPQELAAQARIFSSP
jgi:hypothetical protein